MSKRALVAAVIVLHVIVMLSVRACYYGSKARPYVPEPIDPDETLVSVVVPVYNSADYLEACLDTLFNQTLERIEYIFVDDLGTDNSVALIEEYIRAHNVTRDVRILHNPKNIGPGPSRNAGIEAAQGRYVGFMDPDDWVAPDFFENLYTAAEFPNGTHYDIAKGTMFKVTNGTRKYSKHKPIQVNGKGNHFIYEQFHWQHITGLFRRDMLVRHPDARYGVSNIGEDLVFLLTAGYYAGNITFTKADYFYRIREGSLSSLNRTKFYKDKLESVRERVHFCFRNAKKRKVSNEFVLFTMAKLKRDRKSIAKMSNTTKDKSYSRLVSEYAELINSIGSYLAGTLDYSKYQ